MEWSYKFHWRYCGGTGGKVNAPSVGQNYGGTNYTKQQLDNTFKVTNPNFTG
jgi:hypothetical protein